MKQTITILLAFMYGASLSLHAQVVGQDAEGFSTIILPSSNLYLEVADPKASFSFYTEAGKGKVPNQDLKDYQDAFNDKNIHEKETLDDNDINSIRIDLKENFLKANSGIFKESRGANYAIIGGEIAGGISDGLSTLFSGGEFSTSNTITGFVGYNYTRLNYKDDDDLINEYIKAKFKSDSVEKKLVENEKVINSELDKLVRLGALNSGQKEYYGGFNSGKYKDDIKGVKQFKKEIEKLSENNRTDFTPMLTILSDVRELAEECKKIASQIVSRDQLDKSKNEVEKSQADLIKAKADLQKKLNSVKPPRKATVAEQKEIDDKSEDRDRKAAALADLKTKAQGNLTNKSKLEGNTKEIADLMNTASSEGRSIHSEIKKTFDNDYYNLQKWEAVITLLNKKLDDYEYFVYNQNGINFDALIQAYADRLDALGIADEQMAIHIKNLNKIDYFTRTIIYARGGYSGASFKLDNMNDAMTIDDRFSDVKFDGYSLNFGLTRQWRVYNYIGFSTGISYDYNAPALESRTFKLTTEDTSIVDGTFSSTEEITALTGTFDKFLRYNLSMDYVHLFKLKESLSPDNNTGDSHLYLSLNPYIRHFAYNGSETLKNNTVIGIGVHAFNSKDNKLMGGVFVQTNDTFGANKSTPNALGNRFVFGLIAKFGFTGLKPETK